MRARALEKKEPSSLSGACCRFSSSPLLLLSSFFCTELLLKKKLNNKKKNSPTPNPTQTQTPPVGNAAKKVGDLLTSTASGIVDGGKAVVGKAGDAAKSVAGAADSALSKITKDDKKKLAIAGGVVLAVAGGVLAWQNQDAEEAPWRSLERIAVALWSAGEEARARDVRLNCASQGRFSLLNFSSALSRRLFFQKLKGCPGPRRQER